MPLVEDFQKPVIYGLKGGSDERDAEGCHFRQEVLVFNQVLDLDGGVERDTRVRHGSTAQQIHRQLWGVEEVGVAQRDVLSARRDLLVDIGEHGFAAIQPQSTRIDRRERAVRAAVRASASRLNVAGKMRSAAGVPITGIPVKRGENGAVGDDSRFTVENGNG